MDWVCLVRMCLPTQRRCRLRWWQTRVCVEKKEEWLVQWRSCSRWWIKSVFGLRHQKEHRGTIQMLMLEATVIMCTCSNAPATSPTRAPVSFHFSSSSFHLQYCDCSEAWLCHILIRTSTVQTVVNRKLWCFVEKKNGE